MAQTLQHGHLVPAPDYDPETDPVLAGLRSHGRSGGTRRAVIAAVVVALLAGAGWLAYKAYDSASRRAADARAQDELASAPVISPRQKAEAWRAEHLGSAEYAGLPMSEGERGVFFVIYNARPGDSISAVVNRFAVNVGSDARSEILGFAKREHLAAYNGRGLWVGDEIRLRIPIDTEGSIADASASGQ